MDSTFIQPYMRGEIELAEMRLESVRRSSVLFAEDLPSVQLHHGDSDETVAVSQAYSMIHAMEALGREPPEFEAFIYEGAGHSLFDLRGAIPRAVEFLRRALERE
jgi:acetyl esterase/lipase